MSSLMPGGIGCVGFCTSLCKKAGIGIVGERVASGLDHTTGIEIAIGEWMVRIARLRQNNVGVDEAAERRGRTFVTGRLWGKARQGSPQGRGRDGNTVRVIRFSLFRWTFD